MSHEHGLVDLSFSEPAGLFSSAKHFHCHLLAPPVGQPHLTTAAFPNQTHSLDLLCNGTLHLSIDRENAWYENNNIVQSQIPVHRTRVYLKLLTSRGSPDPLPELCDWWMRSFIDSPGGMKASACSKSLWQCCLSVCHLYLRCNKHVHNSNLTLSLPFIEFSRQQDTSPLNKVYSKPKGIMVNVTQFICLGSFPQRCSRSRMWVAPTFKGVNVCPFLHFISIYSKHKKKT